MISYVLKLIEWSQSEMLLDYNGKFLEHENRVLSIINHETSLRVNWWAQKITIIKDSHLNNNRDGRLDCREKLKITFNFRVFRKIGKISTVIQTIIFYSKAFTFFNSCEICAFKPFSSTWLFLNNSLFHNLLQKLTVNRKKLPQLRPLKNLKQ